MVIICQQIGTISGSNSLLCNKLVRIYDFRPGYSTVDIWIEGRISPQVGDNSFIVGDLRYRLTLISKNVGTGTVELQLTISDVYVPPPPVEETTHHLEFYVKPHSWYTPGGATDDLALKLSNISGAIVNGMSDAGLIGWDYVSTEVISDIPNNRVIIRVNLNQLGAMGEYKNNSIQSNNNYSNNNISIQSMAIGPWMVIGIAIAVVIIGIGVIVGWALIKVVDKILGENFSGKDVGEHDKLILDNMKKTCVARFPNDAVGYANCIAAGTVAVTGASADFFKDDSIKQAGNDASAKIDICIQQYNSGQITAEQLRICSDKAIDGAGGFIIDQTKDKDTGVSGLLLLGAGLVGLYIITKGSERVATPVLIERERLKARGV